MVDDLLIWQWVDSAFPSGGFTHSGGLEAAFQAGQVDGDALPEWLDVQLTQIARGQLPFMAAAHASLDDVVEIARQCELFLNNHVANRASRLLALSLLRAVEQVFGPQVAERVARLSSDLRAANAPFHWPVIFGVCCNWLGIPEAAARQAFLFINLRGWISAGVRLGITGPLEAQAVQHRLLSTVRALAEANDIAIDDAAQTAPLSDLLQATQDRLYSRLFQS